MSNINPADGVRTMTAGLDSQGRSLAPVTIGGVTLPAGSSPSERYAAIVKANVQPTQGGIGHTDSTVAEMARRDVQAGAKTPPTPQQLEKANKGLTPQQEFENEVREKGLTVEPTTAEQIESDIGLLTGYYKLVAPAMPAETRANLARALETDIAAVLDGKPLTPQQRVKLSQKGAVESLRPNTQDSRSVKPAETSPYTPEQWKTGHASVTDSEGMIPLERLNVAGLSGYVIPKLIEGQTVNVAVFGMLAAAKAAGFTQSQVTAWCREQLKAEGLLK